MNQVPISIVLWLLGLAFAAGGAWFALKESRRHVNGVGAKLNRANEVADDRFRKISLAVMSFADTPEKKQQLLDWLK